MSLDLQRQLTRAARKGNLDGEAGVKEKWEELKEFGGDINWCERPCHRTALWEAASRNHEAVVQWCISKGGNVNAADFEKRTGLHEAAYHGFEATINLLLENGANINAQDKDGHSPLMRAVSAKRGEVIKMLVLDEGCDASIIDNNGLSAQHLARFYGDEDLSWWLFCHGSRKNRFEIEGGLQSPTQSPAVSPKAADLPASPTGNAAPTLLEAADGGSSTGGEKEKEGSEK